MSYGFARGGTPELWVVGNTRVTIVKRNVHKIKWFHSCGIESQILGKTFD